jgi:hypothetical protein
MSDYSDEWDDTPERSINEPNFKPSITDWSRVGLPGGDRGIAPSGKLERATMEPLERFRMYVDAISRNLNNWDSINISEMTIQRMLEKASLLEYVGYKNPTAYILGFLATGGGQKLTKKNFDEVISEVLPHVEDDSVFPPDILRYSRLWEKIK